MHYSHTFSVTDPHSRPLVVSQLYRLCWSLRNRTEKRIDLEDDNWTDDQDSDSMETDGTSP